MSKKQYSNTFVIDCGQCHSHVLDTQEFYQHGKGYEKVSHIDIINLTIPGIKSGDRIIVEEAHLRAQEEFSLAQPFTYEQLTMMQKNAQEKGVQIFLFPQKTTPTARKIANLLNSEISVEKTTDENDIKAIALFLTASPTSFSQLKKFTPLRHVDYEGKNKTIFEDKTELNRQINKVRNLKYGIKGAYGYNDAVTNWIKKYIPRLVSEIADEEVLSTFGVEMDPKHPTRVKSNVLHYKSDKLKRLYNVILTILQPNGELRLRSDIGKPAYWKYAKENYFGITPYHMKGGVVASNYKYHLRKASSHSPFSMTIDDGKNETKKKRKIPMSSIEHYNDIKEERALTDKKLRILWTTLRKMIVQDSLR